jgi:hypothetical protein
MWASLAPPGFAKLFECSTYILYTWNNGVCLKLGSFKVHSGGSPEMMWTRQFWQTGVGNLVSC